MTLTSAQQLRLKIQDLPTLADATYAGDGTANTFALPQRNLSSASAFVPIGNTAWSATGATFNSSGQVAFSGVISANSAFRVTYVYSTFSDEEVDHLLSAGGTIMGGAIEACHALMFDSLRRSKWASPDGTQFDDTAAQQAVMSLFDRLQQEQGDEALAGGDIVGWSLNQELY